MPSIKFIHAADLHLDTPFRGLSRLNPELAKRIKHATFRAFEQVIERCISEKVDFLLIAGDIFDGESKSLGAQLALHKQLARLSQLGIWTYMICGNHDPLDSWMHHQGLPDKVHRFGADQVERVTFENHKGIPVDLYGISYKKKAITENISLKYVPESSPSHVSIALLHGNLTGNTQHDNYAPFTLADLQSKPFDYWALGHIHLRQVLSEKNPFIAYPGNPQGRDFGEKGEKGCFLVEIAPGLPPVAKFMATQVVRFEEVDVDLTGVAVDAELAARITQAIDAIPGYTRNSSVMIRLRLTGSTVLHHTLSDAAQISSLIDEMNEGELQQEHFRIIDSIRVMTAPVMDLAELKKGNDFIAEVLREFESLGQDPAKAGRYLDEISGEMLSAQFKKDDRKLSEEEKAAVLRESQMALVNQLKLQ